MSSTLEKITQDAVHLPRQQRLALARFLIELDDPANELRFRLDFFRGKKLHIGFIYPAAPEPLTFTMDQI